MDRSLMGSNIYASSQAYLQLAGNEGRRSPGDRWRPGESGSIEERVLPIMISPESISFSAAEVEISLSLQGGGAELGLGGDATRRRSGAPQTVERLGAPAAMLGECVLHCAVFLLSTFIYDSTLSFAHYLIVLPPGVLVVASPVSLNWVTPPPALLGQASFARAGDHGEEPRSGEGGQQVSYIRTGTLRPPHGYAPPLAHARAMATAAAARAGVSTPTHHPPGRHTIEGLRIA
eukprot:6213732-Pleurochrysis_carterae.AAC.2